MLNVAVCSILGIAHSWKLGLVVVFGGLPPLLCAGWLKIRLDMRLDHSNSKQSSASASIASEAITAIRTVSSLAIEERVLQRYTAELDHAVSTTIKPLAGVMICFALTQSIEYWFMALGFWYGPSSGEHSGGFLTNSLQGTAAASSHSTSRPCMTSSSPLWPSSSQGKQLPRCSSFRPVSDPRFSAGRSLMASRHHQRKECRQLPLLAIRSTADREGDG